MNISGVEKLAPDQLPGPEPVWSARPDSVLPPKPVGPPNIEIRDDNWAPVLAGLLIGLGVILAAAVLVR